MTDEFVIAVTKVGYNVETESDVNNFVFHSAYNTFKIVRSGIVSFTVNGSEDNQVFKTPHILQFTPLVNGFAKLEGGNFVFAPGSYAFTVEDFSQAQICTIGVGSGLLFKSISSDDKDVIFEFDNSGSTVNVHIRFYCLEAI